jgi:hypothetical protein
LHGGDEDALRKPVFAPVEGVLSRDMNMEGAGDALRCSGVRSARFSRLIHFEVTFKKN